MYVQDKITVGQSSGDIRGNSCRSIQLAVDAMAFRGGGRVEVAAGEYIFEAPLRLRSNVSVVGVEGKTIFRHGPVVWSPLAVDADTGQKQFTPENPDVFSEDRGVCFRSRSKPGKMATMPRTIVGRQGDDFLLDDYNVEDFEATDGALAVTYYPLVHGYKIENASLESVVLDAAADSMGGLDMSDMPLFWGGAMYLRYARNCIIRGVEAKNAVGDGLRWGRSEHVTLENCSSHNNLHYGMHPGSHSPFTVVRNSSIYENGSDGLYLCWGVHDGEFTGNKIYRNGYRIHRNGISIGHKDTDNLIADNHVYENAKHGICFRIKTPANGAHRNRVIGNIFENNGRPAADIPPELAGDIRNEVQCCGVFIRGVTHDLSFEGNIVRETRDGDSRYQYNGFYLDEDVSRVSLKDNEVSGHPGSSVADYSGSGDNDLQSLA